jgi:fructose-1,6-bisphosphatase/sedoheptulose 1,7-bisphosphatase-like protein
VRHAQALRHSNAAGPHTDQRRGKGNRNTIDQAAITASRQEAAA